MPTTDKRPLKVFLCHAHADRDAVRGLYARLTKDGVDVWLDKEKLLPGQDWELEIRKAVREADVVVVCLSKQFNQAGFRQKEVRLALDTAMEKPEGEIFIIPARLEECDTLESLRKWHWVDLFEEDGYEMLMRALRARANRIGATLQVKKSWLPKITAQRLGIEKPVEEKDAIAPSQDEFEIKINKEKVGQKVIEDKEKRETAEKVEEEKKQRELKRALMKMDQDHKRQIRRIEWQYSWETFIGEIRYRFKLLRINFKLILILLIGLVIVIPLLIDLFKKIPELTQVLNNTPTATVTFTAQLITPSKTIEQKQTPIEASTPTATSLPAEITDVEGVPMVLVPEGEFLMGSNDWPDQQPIHTVSVNAYFIDKFEVTNADYKVCVDAGICNSPSVTSSKARNSYYRNIEFDQYPVIYVDWYMAKNYCEWRGGRLPTEAEWEKAARGVDGRTYPWGEDINCDLLNYDNCQKKDKTKIGSEFNTGDTTKVGSYVDSVSPYGLFDMAGNVWEWVNDWYDDDYYYGSLFSNPLGPETGLYRILRGGSWGSTEYYSSTTVRNYYRSPEWVSDGSGFRCAKDANP